MAPSNSTYLHMAPLSRPVQTIAIQSQNTASNSTQFNQNTAIPQSNNMPQYRPLTYQIAPNSVQNPINQQMPNPRNLYSPQLDRMTPQMANRACRESFLYRLKLIPVFSGKTRKDLTEFLDIADSLFSFCQTQEEYMEFIIQVTLQLRGEARTMIDNQMEWYEIRQTLISQFNYLSNTDIINSQIENLRQQKDETVLRYAERTRELLLEKHSSYNNITSEQKQEHDRAIRKNFARGLSNEKLREKILLRGTSSLDEAISLVFEMENDFDNDIRKNELFCNFCKMNGHRMKDCRKREQNNSQMGQLINIFKSFGVNNRNNSNNYQRGNNSGGNNNNRNFSRNNGNGYQRNNSNFNSNRNNYNNNYGNNNNNNFRRNNDNNNGYNRNANNNNGNNQYNQGNNSQNNGNARHGQNTFPINPSNDQFTRNASQSGN